MVGEAGAFGGGRTVEVWGGSECGRATGGAKPDPQVPGDGSQVELLHEQKPLVDPGDHGVSCARVGDKGGKSGDRVRAEEGRDRA